MRRLHIRTVLCLIFEARGIRGTARAYCCAYARWRTAEELLARMRDSDPQTAGVLIKGHYGDARRNPLIKVAADAAADMMSYAAQFGVAPAARGRISAGGTHEPGPGTFDGLLRWVLARECQRRGQRGKPQCSGSVTGGSPRRRPCTGPSNRRPPC
jgi:P27 family predicted phage terminase small subunit